MKIFNLLKKLFNVQTVDEISEEMIDNYYNETEKTEEVVEEKTEEVVENAEPEATETEEKVEETTEATEEVVEETKEEVKEEVVENAEPEVVEETKEEEKKEEVLTKEVINSSKGNMPMDTSDLMKLSGKQFFDALYKNRKNLM